MPFDLAEAISGFAGRPLWGVEDWGFWKIKPLSQKIGPLSAVWHLFQDRSAAASETSIGAVLKKYWSQTRFQQNFNCWIEVDTHRGVLMVGKGWGGHPTDLLLVRVSQCMDNNFFRKFAFKECTNCLMLRWIHCFCYLLWCRCRWIDGQLAIEMLSVTSQPGCCKSRKLQFVPVWKTLDVLALPVLITRFWFPTSSQFLPSSACAKKNYKPHPQSLAPGGAWLFPGSQHGVNRRWQPGQPEPCWRSALEGQDLKGQESLDLGPMNLWEKHVEIKMCHSHALRFTHIAPSFRRIFWWLCGLLWHCASFLERTKLLAYQSSWNSSCNSGISPVNQQFPIDSDFFYWLLVTWLQTRFKVRRPAPVAVPPRAQVGQACVQLLSSRFSIIAMASWHYKGRSSRPFRSPLCFADLWPGRSFRRTQPSRLILLNHPIHPRAPIHLMLYLIHRPAGTPQKNKKVGRSPTCSKNYTAILCKC